MTHTDGKLPASSEYNAIPKRRVNWHEAASCAVQIELRDYADILDFQPEFILGQNSYRIDLLVIKKLSSQPIPKNIAHIFKAYNLFEIKELTTANLKSKGESLMVCEGLLNLFGTSSEEIIARAKKESDDYYLPKINELSSDKEMLSSQINYLKKLLAQNNIAFDLSSVSEKSDTPNQ